MLTIYEGYILETELDIRDRIEDCNFLFVGDCYHKRYLYSKDLKEKDNFLTLKESSDGVVFSKDSLELSTCDLEDSREFLLHQGYMECGEQEYIEHHYIIDNVDVYVYEWPHIPKFLRVSGTNQDSVIKVVEQIGYNPLSLSIYSDVKDIYNCYPHMKNRTLFLKFLNEKNNNMSSVYRTGVIKDFDTNWNSKSLRKKNYENSKKNYKRKMLEYRYSRQCNR